jgi:tryptophanyl-tRNA synthetase
METILTGLRTNADYHIGNYYGALKPLVEFANAHADEYVVNLFAPDLHSFTTPIEHSSFYEQTMSNVRLFIAAGLNTTSSNVHVYRQSHVPAHSELAWILQCFTGYGEASRMVEFKDKSARLGEAHVSMGLLNYPMLMAADILLYGAKWVPVGEDQRQHLELARTLAERINNKFSSKEGDLFIVPETPTAQHAFFGQESGVRIRSLKDPSKKMSKSISDPNGTIGMHDSLEDIRKKIMGATTDDKACIRLDWVNQPGVSNLLQLLSVSTGEPMAEVRRTWEGQERYGDFKKAVADAVCEDIARVQASYAATTVEQAENTLRSGETYANETANKTLRKVQQAIGLYK